jgi:hypothetical protein
MAHQAMRNRPDGAQLVAQCETELKAFITQHNIKDIAPWLIALQNFHMTIMRKIQNIQEAEIVE